MRGSQSDPTHTLYPVYPHYARVMRVYAGGYTACMREREYHAASTLVKRMALHRFGAA